MITANIKLILYQWPGYFAIHCRLPPSFHNPFSIHKLIGQVQPPLFPPPLLILKNLVQTYSSSQPNLFNTNRSLQSTCSDYAKAAIGILSGTHLLSSTGCKFIPSFPLRATVQCFIQNSSRFKWITQSLKNMVNCLICKSSKWSCFSMLFLKSYS